MKYEHEDVENSLRVLEEFWASAPSLYERYRELDHEEAIEFLDEDYTLSKDHTDALLAAEMTAEQRARLDKVLAVRDEWTERLERLARGK